MKPMKLVMNAFGPYASKAEVNFEEFGDKGIFLITGDTGAGKTTIFDAISFALFNKTSGTDREVNTLRSDFADSKEDTYVELTFSHMGREYCITRSPAYDVPKKRGEGLTKRTATATLIRELETPIEGTSAVTDAVEDIIRINYDQFKQISMIAQGEFRKVLNADARARGEILQKIFSTAGYRKMGEIMESRYKSADGDMANLYRSIEQYFEGASCAEDSIHRDELDLEKKLSGGEKRSYQVDKKIRILEHLVEEDVKKEESQQAVHDQCQLDVEEKERQLAVIKENQAKFDAYDKAIQEEQRLASQKEDMEVLAFTLEQGKKAYYEVKPAYDAYQEAKAKKREVEKSLLDAEETYLFEEKRMVEAENRWNALDKNKERIEIIQTKATLLKQEEPLYSKRDSLTAEQKNLEASMKAQKKSVEDGEALKGKKSAELQNYEGRKKELASAPETQVKENQKLEQLTAKKDTLNGFLKNAFTKLEIDKKALEDAQKDYITKREHYDEVHRTYEEKEKLFEASSAGILASKLMEGVACPVCGSLEHPAPAQLTEEAVTKEELDLLKDQRTLAEQKKNQANSLAVAKLATYEEASKNLFASVKAELGELDVSQDMEDLKAQVEEAAKKTAEEEKLQKSIVETWSKAVKELKAVDEQLTTLAKALEEGTTKLEEDKKALQQTETQLATVSGQLDGIGKLEFDSLEAAVGARKGMEEDVAKFQKLLTETTDALQKAKENMASANTRVEACKEQEKEAAETVKEKEAVYFAKREAEGFDSEETFLAALMDKKAQEESEATLQNYRQAIIANKAVLAQTKEAIEGRVRMDSKEAEEALAKSKELVEKARKELNDILYRRENNSTILKSICRQQEKAGEKMEEVTTLSNLSRLLRGQMAGSSRTSLETYIQMSGFEAIIHAANKRLQPMSGGQYQMFRHEDLDSKKNDALNLDILDNYTGKKRPVSTLSGGESFLASLSLALGLSDRVSANAGGIKIDTLFIDEGFGTLDEKSLNDALSMLHQLSDSNKLIGIISHREELKEVIPKKLLIQKTEKGSQVSTDLGM